MGLALLATTFVACEREPEAAGKIAFGTTSRAVIAPVAPGACPATGLWAACAVVVRLERAGLVPRLDSAPATETPMTQRGVLLHVGSAELELYIYPDSLARARDEAALDRAKYIDYATPQTMRQFPTLIHSANLIAILHSISDHQRERIADAITAGPPQPPRP